jgi:beta propeller repeat protein
MAAPHVSGVAALILSAHLGTGNMNNELLKVVIEASADDVGEPGFDVGTGYGRVNAYQAVLASLDAVTRPELIAKVSTDTLAAAPDSPIAVYVNVKNVSNVAASNVSVHLFEGDPDDGGIPLRQLTVPLIDGGTAYESTQIVSFSVPGDHDVYVRVNPVEEETAVFNNKAWTRVGVADYQYLETVVADDEGLNPVSYFVTQSDPAISADRVVWLDNRDSQESGDGIVEIYMLDLSTGVETRVTDVPSRKQDPDVSGDRIVWIDRRNGQYDVFMYDLSTGTETQITSDTFTRSQPRIDGNWVVWSDSSSGNSDVYAYNAVWELTIQLTTDPASQSAPDVSGSRVVFQDTRSGLPEIYSYDLSTAEEELLVANPGVMLLYSPRIQGDKVAWNQGYFNTPSDMDIGIYMLDLNQSTIVQLTGGASGGDWYPVLSENDVAWDRGLFAQDVYVMNLQTGVSTRLTRSGSASWGALDTSGGRVVWEETRETADYFYYDYNIYMAEPDIFPAAPQNLSAVNGGSGTIDLDWDDNSDDDLDGYRIYRSRSSAGPFTLVGTTNKSRFEDTGLNNGVRYYYRVCAIDEAAGESSYSNEAYATPSIINSGGSPIFRKSNPHMQE